MKKNLFTILLILLTCSTMALALEIHNQPPEEYIKNLQTCTISSTKDIGSLVIKYDIKGLTPDGKCKVIITEHDNYENYELYKVYRKVAQITQESAGIKHPVIKTQTQMIQESKAKKIIYNCLFTPQQRKDLYQAFLKKDGQNGESYRKLGNGGYSFSFDTTKMSSYNQLMMNYQPNTCKVTLPESLNIPHMY